jgi:hypothetical protein
MYFSISVVALAQLKLLLKPQNLGPQEQEAQQ